MSISFGLKQVVGLSLVVADHVLTDPVFFGMQVVRRFPGRTVRIVGATMSKLPADTAQAIGAWCLGKNREAITIIERSNPRGVSAGVLGELALHLGQPKSAIRLSTSVRNTSRRHKIEARALWYSGHMTRAVERAPHGSQLKKRLASELQLYSGTWSPTVRKSVGATTGIDRSVDVAYMLNNSLPYTQSGYTIRSHEVLKGVQNAGLSVAAVTRTGYPSLVGKWCSSPVQTFDGIKYARHLPARLERTPSARLDQQLTYLLEFLRATDAKILHTTTHFVNGLVARKAAETLGIPWVYEVRGILEDTWASAHPEGFGTAIKSEKYIRFRQIETEVAKSADRVVTLGATMAESLVARGVPSERISVVPNGVGENVLSAQMKRSPQEVRETLGIPRAGFWVGAAASIVDYEGFDTLIEAISLVRSKGKDVRLLLAGDGIALPALKEIARLRDVPAVFPGRVPQALAHELVQALDLYCIPRRDDPVCRLVTPLKPVEATGLGRPVLMSDLPGLVEALPSEARMTAKPGAPSAWAEAIVELQHDGDLRRALSTRGREWVEKSASWSKRVEHIVATYQTLSPDLELDKVK
ncbi:glycosyltransferase family 4 protein [Brevibacterium sp. UMB1308A]|uniref:glycosyltransferase family 4 protein n=1 Tax=Brevibacterium sp. UMB1308A TaxID=3050608 RepID=UPI00254CA995|nr:glycosyltransferase family 4 protein [Brevibacterium sp. UMB1308A]MDK8346578.1 glycosyltransferase family 4 protein [Brevibacterium sp. UMB1308B]MDK8713487.1 glycosyltransferase family 4 protein [Brevibacterium sp. UMB1308A]